MAKHKPLPPLEQVRSRLKYDPDSESGLRWLVNAARNTPSGSVAGGQLSRGYWHTPIGGRRIMNHRLIWLLVNGEDPGDLQIDHIDGNPANNRIGNLRLATNSQNAQNASGHRASSSRYVGVTWKAPRGHWEANIMAHSEARYLGVFRCETAAALAYDRAAIALHGEFARPNILPRPCRACRPEGEGDQA